MAEFIAELKKLHTYASTWVAFLASASAAYWLQLGPDEQRVILDAVPALKLVGPAVSFIAFIIARGLPQAPKE